MPKIQHEYVFVSDWLENVHTRSSCRMSRGYVTHTHRLPGSCSRASCRVPRWYVAGTGEEGGYVTWLIHILHTYHMSHIICHMTHPYLTRLIHMSHDSFTCEVKSEWVSIRLDEFQEAGGRRQEAGGRRQDTRGYTHELLCHILMSRVICEWVL